MSRTLNSIRSDSDNVPCVIVYGISSYDSNAMKSSNPHSGIYIAEKARTLDLNGGSPACNQGGAADIRNASVLVLNDQGGAVMDVSYDVAATLRAQDHGHPPLIFDARGNRGGAAYPRQLPETTRAELQTIRQ